MSYVGNKPAQTTIPADDSVTTAMVQDDAVTADKVANAINTSIAANTSKVTNATHTGDVTGATALTIATDAVDIAMLSATGTASATTFLRGDNAWASAGGGKVNQVVSVFKADTFSTSSTSMTDVTGISAAITPSASDSKVLITVSMALGGAGGYLYSLRLKRVLNSVTTYPGVGTAAGSRTPSFYSSASAANYAPWSINFTFLDSPTSTLESTYNVQCMVEGSTFYVGRSFTDTDSALYGRMGSTITLMEILA